MWLCCSSAILAGAGGELGQSVGQNSRKTEEWSGIRESVDGDRYLSCLQEHTGNLACSAGGALFKIGGLADEAGQAKLEMPMIL